DPNSAYGIVFRYNDPQNYNVFAVDGMGRYSIWVREAGTWRELRGTEEAWQIHEGINPIGIKNLLTIRILGDLLVGYINGIEVVSLSDTTFASGSVGIYMGTANTGATIAIDRYIVQASETNEVES